MSQQLPRLLRQLEMAAHDNDEKRMGEIFEMLDRNEGWADSVSEFIDKLGAREFDAIERFRTEAGDPFLGRGGSADNRSGGPLVSPQGFVTFDASAQRAVPQSALEFTSGGFNAPASIWNMQEASGTVADILGTTPLSASAVSYQQSFAGWTRKAITWTEGGVAGLFNLSDTNIPDVSTGSLMVLAYYAVTSTPAAQRCCMLLGGAGGARATVTTAPVYKDVNGTGDAQSATGAANPGTTIRPLIMKVDVPNTTVRLYTDQEKLSPTFAAMTSNKGIFISGSSEAAPATAVVYGAAWFGAKAQMSDATVKAMLQAMGWTIPWS